MENKIIPTLIGAVIIGFATGAGFILAKRVFDKKSNSQSVTPDPISTHKNNFSGEMDDMIMQDYMKMSQHGRSIPGHRSNEIFQMPVQRQFDWSTGTYVEI